MKIKKHLRNKNNAFQRHNGPLRNGFLVVVSVLFLQP
jgi:hypothetical protein